MFFGGVFVKNIFIISQSLNTGGAERVASNLSIELSKNNEYKVYLVLFNGDNRTYPAGCEVINMDIPSTNNKIKRIFVFLRRVLKLRKLKKKYNVDLSISLLSSPNYINVLSKRNDKIITSIRCFFSKKSTSKIKNKIIEYACKKSDKIVCLSKAVEYNMIKDYFADEKNTITIYNSCDSNNLIQNSINDNVEAPNFDYLINMGRLTTQKGQWHLIKSFKVIHECFPQLKLIILGQGEYKEKLNKLIAELNLEDHVYLYGYVKSPFVILKNAKAFLFTSLFEGLGNVLLEAMSGGVPVVSTDCIAGPREIIMNCNTKEDILSTITDTKFSDYGILVPPYYMNEQPAWDNLEITDNERKYADAVIKLLSDQNMLEKYKKASLERIKFFSPEKITNEWVDLIDSMLKK